MDWWMGGLSIWIPPSVDSNDRDWQIADEVEIHFGKPKFRRILQLLPFSAPTIINADGIFFGYQQIQRAIR